MFTPKQERNGTAVGGAEGNTAVPGPDSTGVIAGRVTQSENATDAFQAAGGQIMSGVPGVVAGGLTAGGSLWEWDSGLAVAEQPGEA